MYKQLILVRLLTPVAAEVSDINEHEDRSIGETASRIFFTA